MKPFLIATLLLFLMAGQSLAKGDALCVAVLPPDAPKSDEYPAERNPAPWLDTLLTVDLAGRQGLTLVDRALLDRILDERRLELSGLGETQARGLRAFLAAGVLVVSAIVPTKDAPALKAEIVIQAVIAQTGQLVGDLRCVIEWQDGQWRTPADWQAQLDVFWDQTHRQVERNVKSLLVEVTFGKLTSPFPRFGWVLDEINDSVRTTVSLTEGAVLLVPRQPLSTREERLLRVMGLSAAGEDEATTLAPAPDLRFDVELVEQATEGIAHEETPLQVKLTCARKNDTMASPAYGGTFGSWEPARDLALKWVAEQIASAGGRAAPGPLDEEVAARMAAEEITIAQRGQNRLYHALRAAHLDPTNETAAWMIVQELRGWYDEQGRQGVLASKDRIMFQGRRYLEQFPHAPADHVRDVHWQIGIAASQACNILGKQGPPAVYFTGILPPPTPQIYPYGRLAAEHILLAELKNPDGTTSSNAFSAVMTLRLDDIANCPPDKLVEEQKYWRKFWSDYVEPKRDRDLPPWDLIEVAFAARRKDAGATRAALTRLAAAYPRSDAGIWKLFGQPVVPMYLQAAGDADWPTWQPDFSNSGEIEVTEAESKRFWHMLDRPSLDVWEYEKAPQFEPVRLRLPTEFMLYAQSNCVIPYPRVQAIASADGDLWIASPAVWDIINTKKPSILGVTPIAPLLRADALETIAPITRIDWPILPVNRAGNPGPVICCAHVTREEGRDTVWMGTVSDGLARFEKREGLWSGRWYTERDGLPSSSIRALGSTQNQGTKLIVQCLARDGRHVIAQLDPATGQFRLLGAATSAPLPEYWADFGRRPSLLGQLPFPPRDLSMASFAPVGDRAGQVALTRTQEDTWRLWRYSKEHSESVELWEVSLETLAQEDSMPGRGVSMERDAVVGSRGYAPPSIPLTQIHQCIGVRDMLWMINRNVSDNYSERGHWLMLYRPAARDAVEWAAEDRWIGPFSAPDREPITAILPDGDDRVWITTTNGIYLVSVDRLLSQAERLYMGVSTAQWREDYAARLQRADWRVQVKSLILAGNPEDALSLLAQERAKIASGPPETRLDLLTVCALWEAAAEAAKPGGLINASAMMRHVAEDATASPAARKLARRTQADLVYRAGQWKEFIAVAALLDREFPSAASDADIEYRIAYARKKLAAEPHDIEPATQPPP